LRRWCNSSKWKMDESSSRMLPRNCLVIGRMWSRDSTSMFLDWKYSLWLRWRGRSGSCTSLQGKLRSVVCQAMMEVFVRRLMHHLMSLCLKNLNLLNLMYSYHDCQYNSTSTGLSKHTNSRHASSSIPRPTRLPMQSPTISEVAVIITTTASTHPSY